MADKTISEQQAELRRLQAERRRLQGIDGGGEQDEQPTTPRRMSMGRVVELLLTRPTPEHSSVELTRNAKGETQISVAVRNEDPDAAAAKAAELFDSLRARFPMSSGYVGATEEAGQAHD